VPSETDTEVTLRRGLCNDTDAYLSDAESLAYSRSLGPSTSVNSLGEGTLYVQAERYVA
jgi:hypothetical protein